MNDEASRAAAEDQNLEPLKAMFALVVTEPSPKGRVDLVALMDRVHASSTSYDIRRPNADGKERTVSRPSDRGIGRDIRRRDGGVER